MSWITQVSDILKRYTGGAGPEGSTSAQSDFAQVAEHAPPSVLSSGLTEAFRSQSTPPFGQMLAQLYQQSNPSQRAEILNQLLAAAGPAALAGGSLQGLQGVLSAGGSQPAVTPEQAQQVPPETVHQLATHAEKQDPSVVERASAFYAQHPKLVQGLGAAALAVVIRHISKPH